MSIKKEKVKERKNEKTMMTVMTMMIKLYFKKT
jgi:hypothetical protein